MKLFPNHDETIAGLGPLIEARQISCIDVLSRCLRRIDETEAQIRAWVLVERDHAREAAQALDEELAAGHHRGPLHGIPIGIKDIIDVAGWPTAAGSDEWKNRVAERDATLVARLRAAGAVIIGKTVTTQYASFDPPVTRNPWNLDRTPGGSSSGSAAAVASGMCLAAIGTQTGGSITRPASYCGVAGCKATHGRVSLQGVLPLAPSMDHPGPIAHCVEDLRLVYDTIAGYDPADPYTLDDASGTSPHPEKSGTPRIGQLGGLFHDMATREIRELVGQISEELKSAGARVSPVTLPSDFNRVLQSHRTVMATEAAAVHEKRIAQHPQEYGPCITKLIQEGLSTPATTYARARADQLIFRRTLLQAFQEADVLLCPATTEAAPDAATTGDPAFNSPWSFTGLPVVSLPVSLSPEGLPLAVQLVGRSRSENELFGMAAWCEQVITGWAKGIPEV